MKCDWSFHHKEWKQVSLEGKDLVKKLLTKDLDDRLTAADALKHPWFEIVKEIDGQIDVNVLNTLQNFKGRTKLQKAAANALVKMLQPKEIDALNKQFKALDTENTGYIDAGELSTAM